MKNTSKILYVQAAAERGGVETILLNYLKGIDRERFEPHVFFTCDGPFRREVEELGVPVPFFDCGQVREVSRTIQAIRTIADYIQHNNISLVHNHGDKAHFYGGFAAWLAQVPAIHHLHGVPSVSFSRDGVIGILSLLAARNHTWAVSEAVAREFRKLPLADQKVQVLHNGIHLPPPQASEQDWREKYDVRPDQFLVALFARLQRWKGIHLFIEAAALVARRYPDVCFWIVGGSLFGLEEEYAKDCRELVIKLDLEKNLKFLGHCNQVYSVMETVDIVVNASINPDPFPTVVLEGMACAKPVIATNLGGAPEAIETEQTGFLIPPSSEALADSILQLVADRQRSLAMGQAGYHRYNQEFTLGKMMDSVQKMYSQVLDSSPLTQGKTR
jgi:glycosyltransferase involved in cell wall biosynthesis